MVAALFDTNILIDYLRGIDAARDELAYYTEKCISIITWMEVMAGAVPETEDRTRAFLASFETIELDGQIAERAVSLRKTHRIKLPDAIIWATADINGLLLVTRNVKDFPQSDPGIRCPYQL
jgi:predicted nucleic acid-binding protein